MNMGTRLFNKVSLSIGLGLLLAQAGSAAPLALSDQPLFLSTSVQPNLMMAVDDSGSMDFEVLFRGNDGSAWWRTAASGSCGTGTGSDNNSFVGCIANGSTDLPSSGQMNFNNSGTSSGTWKKFSYLFPNGCNGANTSYQRRLCDSTNDHYSIPPLPAFAWSRAPEHNSAYFDPATTYNPWPSDGGYTFSNSTPTAARFDPVFGTTSNTINLTQDFAGTGSVDPAATCGNSTLPSIAGDYYFRVYTGMTIPTGTCIRVSSRNWEVVRSTGCVVGTSNACLTREGSTDRTYTLASNSSVAIRYFPATFYLSSASLLPATYGYTATPGTGGVAPNGTALLRYEIKPANFASTEQYNTAIQNFANWFTYYRKRHQALRAGLGQAFRDINGMNVGGFTINQGTPDVTMRDIAVTANRTALYQDFYYDWVSSGGTPNRTAVYNLVRNYRRTGASAPTQYYCQKNFGMLFTDGFSNQPASGDGFYSLGNIDGSHGAPYADTVSGTMADGVMDAYVNNIRPDLTPRGRVSTPPTCSTATPDPKADCNTNLHMNFFAVTLGTRGLQFNPDADPAQDPYTTTPTWPTSFPARHPSAVDDIWHATINGRGKLLNAGNPAELATKLSEVLTTIIERTGSASSASVNSGSISENTRVYQARFNSTYWTGELFAYPVSADGDLGTELWEASLQLPLPNDRHIFTINSSGTPAPFRWTSLDTTRQGQLNGDAVLGAAMVSYLRGDATNEGTTTGFRARPTKLGDIISSSPAIVGKPNYRYRDSLEATAYSAFVSAHENRTPIVYVGANDGMLHGFNAETGREVFAFIPSMVFDRLSQLTSRTYSHQYYVDGSPSVADAYIGGNWRTVLVGGLNKGGRGIYALDITNPSALANAETTPENVFMWEFDANDDADLGYTFSQPTIARLHDGRWAAIFGNGYNSPNGTAVLYIVDLRTGALIRKFDTQFGPSRAPTGATWDNGMSTPSVVDIDNDRIQDYVYAGDLYGNLWKFDLRSSNPADWSIPYGTSPKQPLFQARDSSGNAQPITVPPAVIRGPSGVGTMVLFGTGKYLESADRLTTPVRPQTFYGIVDQTTNSTADIVSSRTELTRQEILEERSSDAGLVRITTNYYIGDTRGWYLDLVSPSGYNGEKQVTTPTVRNGVVHFTTLIPTEDPCGAGGKSWVMALDALNGARPQNDPEFDINRDGQLDNDDKVTYDGEVVNVSGLMPEGEDGEDTGILMSPAILVGESGGQCVQYRLMPDSFGNMVQEAGTCGPGGAGRQSWRRIR